MGAASRLSVAITGALASVAVARILGPDGAGAYSIALTFIVMLLTFTTLGVEHGVAYYVSSGHWAARSAFRQAMLVSLVTGGVGVIIGVAARLLVPSAFAGLSVAMTAVVVFALPFALATLYTVFLAVATDHYGPFVLPPAIQSGLTLVLVVALGALIGIWGVVLGITISQVIAALVAITWAQRWMPAVERGSAESSGARQLGRAIGFGVKGYAANGLSFLNVRLDLFVLSAAAGAAEVGIYSVAVSVTSLMWLLPPALSDVLFPRVAALTASNEESAEIQRTMVEEKGLRHVVLIVFISSLVVVLGLLLLVKPVFGSEFAPAIEYGLILVPGAALLGVTGVLAASVVGRGRPDISLYIALLVTPVTLVAYLVLIPARGALGAAVVSSCSYALTFVCFAVAYRRLTGRPITRALVPTIDELRDYRTVSAMFGQAATGRFRQGNA